METNKITKFGVQKPIYKQYFQEKEEEEAKAEKLIFCVAKIKI